MADMITFAQFYIAEAGATSTLPPHKESRALNMLQGALDIAGIEPTMGMLADGANVLISLLRAAAAKAPNNRNKHLINAGISAIALVPFADVIKLAKLRHLSKPLARSAIAGARALKDMNVAAKMTSKTAFNNVMHGMHTARHIA